MGTANIARGVLIPAIQQSTFGTVEAIGSRDLEKARSVAQSLGIARAVGSYEALLDDPNIDADPSRRRCWLADLPLTS